MIRIKRVSFISAKTIAAFDEYSRREWKIMRPLRHDFYRRSRALWTLYKVTDPLCVIGIVENSMIGTGMEVYFLLCKAFHSCLKEMIRFLRRAFRHFLKLYGMITVSIESDFPAGETFVKFFGFKEIPHTFVAENIKYRHFELRASWLQ
jgi:hypothetical protein